MQSKVDFFETNINLLKKFHPETWEMVDGFDQKLPGEYVDCRNGKPNLQIAVGGEMVCLHDIDDPDKEIHQYYELVPEGATGIVFLLGMGFGYSALTLARERKNIRHIVIFELNPAIFIRALYALDLGPLLSDKRVVLAVGASPDVEKIMEPLGRVLQLENTFILNHEQSFVLDGKAYNELNRTVLGCGNRYNIGGATTLTYGKKFLENRFDHLSSVHHDHLLEHLADAFEGVPGIIVSAGPSLDKNVELLSAAKGKAVIFAADSALPALLANDVVPDFTASIDMQDIVYEKIVDASPFAEQTSLVCMPWVNPNVTKNFPARNVLWAFTGKNMEKWLNKLLGGKIATSGATTVAHLSFISAVMMRCSPIVFIGQDLAFTEEKDHSRYSVLKTKKHMEDLFLNNEIQMVEGFGGGLVPTNRALLSMKHHFEKVISLEEEIYFINATEGGARIVGTEEMPLQKVLKLFCRNDVGVSEIIERRIQKNKMASPKKMISEFQRVLKDVTPLEKDLKLAASLGRKITSEIEHLKKEGSKYTSIRDLPISLQKGLVDLDACNDRLDRANRIWSLMDEVTMEGLRQTDRMRHEIDQLEGDPSRYLQWLSKNIERLEAVRVCRLDVLVAFKKVLRITLSHLQKEFALLRKISKGKRGKALAVLDLLRLYFKSGNFVLLRNTIKSSGGIDSAEIIFYLGVIAAQVAQFEEAESCFSKAISLDVTFEENVSTFKQGLVQKYYQFALDWKKVDLDVAKKMLTKGDLYNKGGITISQQLDLAVQGLRTEIELLEKSRSSQEKIEVSNDKKNLGVADGADTKRDIGQSELLPDYYARNMRLLKKNHFQTWAMLNELNPQAVGEIFLSPQQLLNLRLAGETGTFYLQNNEDPEGEVAYFLEQVPEDAFGAVALFGLGLGSVALALVQHRPNIQKFILFDLTPEVFIQAIKHIDLKLLLDDPRVIFHLGPHYDLEKIVAPAANVLQLENIYILNHLPSNSLNNVLYQKLLGEFKDLAYQRNLSGSTSMSFGKDYVQNRFDNLTTIRKNYLLDDLDNKFKDIPAILVSGGPSLDKNIQDIKCAKGRAIIIAADSVLPGLLEHNISPDYVTAIDPQELAFEKIANVINACEGISLISKLCATPLISKNFPAERVFWGFTGNAMEKWLNKLCGGTHVLNEVTSVAHLSFEAARIMGCSPIIFVGQDLAFTGSKDHSSYSFITDEDRTNDLLKSQKDLLWVDGVVEDKVPTSSVFFSMKQQLEKMITQKHGCYINSTEGGAMIAGTMAMPLAKSIRQHCVRTININELLVEERGPIQPVNVKSVRKAFQHTLEKIGTHRSTIKKLSAQISKAKRDFEKQVAKAGEVRSFLELPPTLQKNINEISLANNHVAEDSELWENLAELGLAGLRESERLQVVIDRLEGRPGHFSEWLIKSLEHLDFVNNTKGEILAVFSKYLRRTICYLDKEDELIKRGMSQGESVDDLALLATLYFDHGNFALAKPKLEQFLSKDSKSAEMYYLVAIIAAYQADYGLMEKYFAYCEKLDETYAAQVVKIRHELGERYLNYLQKKPDIGGSTVKRLLLKGLYCCPDHKGIATELANIAQADIESIELAKEKVGINVKADLIVGWVHDIGNNKSILHCLSPQQLSALYRLHGNLLVNQNNFHGAIKSFKEALGYTCNTPQLHIFLTDAYFAIENFQEGITHLKKAVALDRSFARYWENIGDNLFDSGSAQDAILAYEQCFIAQPNKYFLLKKVSDCYIALNQKEAADEAFKMFCERERNSEVKNTFLDG